MVSIKDYILEDDSDIEEEFRSFVQEEYELHIGQLPDNIKTSFRVDYIMNEDDLTMKVKFISENEKINKLGNWETVFKFELVRHPSTYKLEIVQRLERFKLPKTLFEGNVVGTEQVKDKTLKAIELSVKAYLRKVHQIELTSQNMEKQIAEKIVSIIQQKGVSAKIISSNAVLGSQSSTEVLVGRDRTPYTFQFSVLTGDLYFGNEEGKFEIYHGNGDEWFEPLYSVDISKVSVEDIVDKVISYRIS